MLETEFAILEQAVDANSETLSTGLLSELDTWQAGNYFDYQLAFMTIGYIGQHVSNEPVGFTEAISAIIVGIAQKDPDDFEGFSTYVDEQQADTEATPKEVAKRILRWIGSLFD